MTSAFLAAAATGLPDALVRALLTLAFLGLVLVAALLMRRSWTRKAESLADLPELPRPTADQPELAVEGRYLGSTVAGEWLSRVVARGLGAPSRCSFEVTAAGIVLKRPGVEDFLVPRGSVRGVRTDRAIAGKAYERDGIIVVTWQHGELQLDTGFRADATEDHLRLLAAIGDWNNG